MYKLFAIPYVPCETFKTFDVKEISYFTIPKSIIDCAVAIMATRAERGCQSNNVTAFLLLVSA